METTSWSNGWRLKKNGRPTLELLRGKTILEATPSDGFSTSYLCTNKSKFGFAEVVPSWAVRPFRVQVKTKENFDAVVTNPPWDESFLEVFYKFLLFLNKPFVLILRRRGTRHQLFQKVFGNGAYRTIIS